MTTTTGPEPGDFLPAMETTLEVLFAEFTRELKTAMMICFAIGNLTVDPELKEAIMATGFSLKGMVETGGDERGPDAETVRALTIRIQRAGQGADRGGLPPGDREAAGGGPARPEPRPDIIIARR
jgi:hypothetical protein